MRDDGERGQGGGGYERGEREAGGVDEFEVGDDLDYDLGGEGVERVFWWAWGRFGGLARGLAGEEVFEVAEGHSAMFFHCFGGVACV